MLHALINTTNNLLLRAKAVPAGKVSQAKSLNLPADEPIILVGYFHDAPIFIYDKEDAILELLEHGVLTPEFDGPIAVFMHPHVDDTVISHTTIFNGAITPGREGSVLAI